MSIDARSLALFGVGYGAASMAHMGAITAIPAPAQTVVPLGGAPLHRAGGRRRVLPYIAPATPAPPDYAPPDIPQISVSPAQPPLKRSKNRRDTEHALFLH